MFLQGIQAWQWQQNPFLDFLEQDSRCSFCFNLYVFFRFLKLLSSASMAMVGSFQPFFDKQSLYSVSLDRAWAFWLPSAAKVPEHHGN
jgi:hypothetical protein